MSVTSITLALLQVAAVAAVGARASGGEEVGRPTILASLQAEAAEVIEAIEKPWDSTVKHKKEAGNGYLKGSPLYKKQQELKAEKESYWGDWSKFQNHLNKGEYKDAWKALTWWMILETFIGQLSYVLIVLLAAFLYKRQGGKAPLLSEKNLGTVEPKESWAFGFFEFTGAMGEDMPICGMAACCPLIRWADTISNPKVTTSEPKAPQTGLGFWQALGGALFLVFLSPFTGGLSTFVLFGAMVFYRHKLRQIFNHSPGTAGSVCTDCWGIWCCTCCALVQDAREVEKVIKPRQ